MANAYLKAGTTTKYTFNIISGLTHSNKSSEQTPMNIPGVVNPFVMDGKCQERRVTFEFYIIPSAWSGTSVAGEGSILTQSEDLDYLFRNQADILAAAGVSAWTLAVNFPANMDHAPDDALTVDGVPSTASGSAVKNYFGIISSITFPRNGGELHMIATVEFLEADEVFGL